MNLVTNIELCEIMLFEGHQKAGATEIDWLNEICEHFLQIFKQIQNTLKAKYVGKVNHDNIVVSVAQTGNCLYHFQKIVHLEATKKTKLSLCRKHFLERMEEYTERLKSSIRSLNDNTEQKESNCVDFMNTALDLIAPYLIGELNETISSISEEYNQLDTKYLRSTVDSMISQILSFANIALAQDKVAMVALCRTVMKECIEFSGEYASKKPLKNSFNLKANLLESAILKLEKFLNESLLRLVFTIFAESNKKSINELRKLIVTKKSSDTVVDHMIASFDINMDRIIQIGSFASAFTPNAKVRISLKSSLASLESLESFLIPSLYSKNVHESLLLEEHFNEEMQKYQDAIQEIIDTVGFCNCYIDILSNGIKASEDNFNKIRLREIVEMGKFLHKNLELYFKHLKLPQSDARLQLFRNFILMIEECLVVTSNNRISIIDNSKIVVRFKILLSTITRLKDCLDGRKSKDDVERSCTFNSNQSKESSVITVLAVKSAIKKKRQFKEITNSLRGNFSRLPSIKGFKRRVSVRTSMFKGKRKDEIKNLLVSGSENCTSLQVSDILNQLTVSSLSSRRNW